MDWQPIPEARLEQSEQDELVPASAGWFVVNVADARGLTTDDLGSAALFEGNHDQGIGFEEFGLNIQVLDPGQPNCMYHRENQQEGYLVLFGECLLIVEEQERRMRQWDYAHLPSGTAHVCVGAGEQAVRGPHGGHPARRGRGDPLPGERDRSPPRRLGGGRDAVARRGLRALLGGQPAALALAALLSRKFLRSPRGRYPGQGGR